MTPPATAATPAPVTGAASVREPRPGFVVGRVLMPDRNPIAVPAATIAVSIAGVSCQSGQHVSFATNPKADGSFEPWVQSGSYRVSAAIELPFNGERFGLDLHPDGPRVGDRDSEPGIAQDFTWFTQGRRPDTEADTNTPFHFFGAYASMRCNFYRDDIRRSFEASPLGTRLLFTLTLVGPRIDGTPAETLTYQLSYDAMRSDLLLDIPIAPYVVTGTEITPDGTRSPLLMRVGVEQYAPSAELRFRPASYGGEGARAVLLGFTRSVP